MKLQSKKARLPIAALGVAALCTGGLGAFASPASAAPTAIDLNSGNTTPSVANLGTTTSAATAATAYAMKIQDASITNMAVAVESGPAPGSLLYEKIASNGLANTTFSSLAASSTEVQTLTMSGTPATGSYTVTVGSATTASITTYTAAALQSALNLVVGDGDDITVGLASNVYTITFGGSLAGTNIAQATTTTSSLATAVPGPITIASATTTDGGTQLTAGATLGTVANSDYLYMTANWPGTYKVRLFQDTNGSLTYDAADERSSSLITLTVYDAIQTTTTTADDVAPVISAPSPVGLGQAVTGSVTYSKPISLTDARGSQAAGLAGSLAALTFIDVAPSTTGFSSATNATPTYSPGTGAITYALAGTSNAIGTAVVRGDLKTASGSTDNTVNYGTKSVVVTNNTVTGITLVPTLVDGKVIATGGAVTVKAGTNAVTYTSTAVATTTPVAGATVNFTIGGTAANVALLTTNGTAVDTTSTTSKVYSAVTNASGVASLTVTSSAAAAADAYTVSASTNGQTASPALTTTYAAPAAAAIATTSTAGDLTPAYTATSVVLKGKLTDQFGAAFVPSSSSSQQVGIEIPDGTPVGFATIGADGAFSYTYTPATAQVAGTSVTFDFTYGTVPDGASPGGTIRWASTTSASNVVISAPADAATGVVLQRHTAATGTGVAVTGIVSDAASAGLAFKTVVLTGSDGVYFAADTNGTDAKKSFTAVTDNSGAIQAAYAFFTKSGQATITATSGTATDTNTVTTADSIDPYKITVDDVSGSPGSTLIVTGKVTDMFGNGVPDNGVALNTGSSTVGAVASPNVSTNSDGVFSTTFVSGSNQSGEVTLTATMYQHLGGLMTAATVLTPAATWKSVVGLTFPDGDYQDSGTITVSNTDLTLVASSKVTAGPSGARALLSGKFLPNTSIDIYAKASGAAGYSFIDTTSTDAEGDWGSAQIIRRSTYFLARSSGLSSLSDQTQVFSRVGTITAKALGGGMVRLYANGDPNAKGPMVFYRAVAGVDPKLKGLITNSYGSATVTVKLPKGLRYVYATYQAAGTGKGNSKRIAVQVK